MPGGNNPASGPQNSAGLRIPCQGVSTQAEGRGGAQAKRDNDARRQHFKFPLKPPLASLNVMRCRRTVHALKLPCLEAKVLDRVRQEYRLAREAGLTQHGVEKAAQGTGERFSDQIVVIVSLFANQCYLRIAWPGAGDGVGRVLPQFALTTNVEPLI